MPRNLNKPEKAYLFISLFAFGYLIARAIMVPLAHDEIATFHYYIQPGSFIPSFAHWDANNHVLNSFLGWVFYSIFGNTSLALRLSNLVFFPVFIFFTLLISRNLKSEILQAGLLFTLLLMHNFIDFFGLSRGYGMSMALMMGSIFHLLVFLKTRRTYHLTLLLIFNLIFLAANLSLFLISLILMGVAILKIIADYSKMSRKDLLEAGTVLFFLGFVPSLIFARLLFHMQEIDLLYYGSDDGIWAVTARSVIRLLAGSSLAVYEYYWAVMLIIILLSGIVVLTHSIRRKQLFEPATILFFLPLAAIISTVILNIIIGVNYPEDRVGIYFFPLLILSFFFTAGYVSPGKYAFLWVIPFIWLPVDLGSKLNFTYSECYKTDYLPEAFFTTVSSATGDDGFPATIGSYRTRHFVWSYYDYCRDGNQNPIFWSNYPGNETDFLITELWNYPGWQQYYEAIDYDGINKRHLLKRKEPAGTVLVGKKPVPPTPGLTDREFSELCVADVDTLSGRDLRLDYEIQVHSPDSPFIARIVASVHDGNHRELRYEYIQLNWLRNEWAEGTSVLRNSFILHDLPGESAILKLYLWSIHGHTYEIREGSCQLYVLMAD